MQKLYELLQHSEDRLIELILLYAKKHNYVKYTSTLQEAWRASIAGLSNMIMLALKSSSEIPEVAVHHNSSDDPIKAFAIPEAAKHRRRGISLTMFMGLLKYYRQSYLDIVSEAGFDPKYFEWSNFFINRVFDRMEIGILSEWLDATEGNLVVELQRSNRLLVNEKNWYITIFESLPTPVIFLGDDCKIRNMNHAASNLFEFSGPPGAFYYRSHRSAKPLNCIEKELHIFATNTIPEHIFEKAIFLNGKLRHFEVKLARMLDVSKKFNGIIIIMNDISDRKKIEDTRFSLARQQLLTNMAIELSVSEERERRRISSDLHDNIGQALLLGKIRLGSILGLLPATHGREELKEVMALQDQIIQSVRSLSQQLSPPVLYNVGLEAAIKWLGKQMEDNYSLKVTIIDDEKQKTLSEDMRAIVFQACRELLINVSKHAQCASAEVAITKERSYLKLTVKDSGSGFDPAAAMGAGDSRESGLGLFLIQERVKHLGGKTTIRSAPDQGTCVTISVPLTQNIRQRPRHKAQAHTYNRIQQDML